MGNFLSSDFYMRSLVSNYYEQKRKHRPSTNSKLELSTWKFNSFGIQQESLFDRRRCSTLRNQKMPESLEILIGAVATAAATGWSNDFCSSSPFFACNVYIPRIFDGKPKSRIILATASSMCV